MDCPVCLDIYRKPLLLPGCGHTICEQCAKVMVTDENFLTCPECRLVYHLRRGIASLPTNIALQRTISEAQTCQTHKILCCKHPEDTANLFCHTCNTNICLKCYFSPSKDTEQQKSAEGSSHYGHNVITIDDALSREKRLLEDGRSKLESMIIKEKEYATNLQETENKIKEVLEEKLSKIDKEKNQLIATIKQTSSKLKFILKGTVVRDTEALLSAKNAVISHIETMENLHKEYENVLQKSKVEYVPVQTFVELRSQLAKITSLDATVDIESCLRLADFDTSVASSLDDPNKALSRQTELPLQPSIHEDDCVISSTSALIALRYKEVVRVEKLVLHYKEALFKGLSEKPWENIETTSFSHGKSSIHLRNLRPGCMYKVKLNAHNTHGNSPASKELWFRTFDGCVELRSV